MDKLLGVIDVDPLIFRSGFAGTERWYEVKTKDGKTHKIQYKADFPDEDEIESYEAKQKSAPINHVIYNLKMLYKKHIPSKLPSCDRFVGYITGDDNFRYQIYPDYKCSRTTALRPEHLNEMRKYCVETLGCKVINDIEADDAVAIVCTQKHKQSVLIAVDKDLLQVPGYHFNPVKEEKLVITPEEGTKFLFQQVIAGDPTDDIPGIAGMGMKKAAKALEGCNSAEMMYNRALEIYQEHGLCEDDLWRTGCMVYMLRSKDDSWDNYVERIHSSLTPEEEQLLNEHN